MTAADVAQVLRNWANDRPPTLAELGGEAAALEAAGDLADDPSVPLLLEAVVGEWDALVDQAQAAERFVEVIGSTANLMVLNRAIDIAADAPHLLEGAADRIVDALLPRIRQRASAPQAALAAAALDGALQLELGAWTQRRLELAGAMSAVSESEHDEFAAPALGLVGRAYEQWRFDELKDAARRLGKVSGLRREAMHELAMMRLVDAFEADTPEALWAGMREARDLFAAADRDDSKVYAAAIDAIAAFASEAPADQMGAAANLLTEHVRRRDLGLVGMHERWIGQRAATEHEWVRLAWLLTAAAQTAEERTIDPVAVARQLLSAYATARSTQLLARVSPQRGVAHLVEPRITASLLRRAEIRTAAIRIVDEGVFDDAAGVAQLREILASGKKKPKSRSPRSTRC